MFKATISKVLTFSCVDGPGNRLVLFCQGCNFNCKACHNPHTMGVCDHCGICIPKCHAGTLSLKDGRIAFDPEACDHCDDCLRACPINANPMSREMSVDEVLDIIRENAAFLDGITASGGEATMHLKFLFALFEAVKADPDLCHLTCMIDSNGYLGPESWARILPVTDGVMLDIKAMDADTHTYLTAARNRRVLESALLLKAAGKLHEVRFLIIPGYTDQSKEVAQFTAFVEALGKDTRIRLNAFQHHGVIGPARSWPTASKETVERIAGIMRRHGIEDVATPVVYV